MALKEDGWPVFLDALATGDTSKAIMDQEARGQAALVNGDVLPREGVDALIPAGVVVGDPVDDLFVRVTLPAGWRKVPTEHSMWSKLVDDKGRERAAIFYKAAFYDRKAHINLTTRYSASYTGEDWDQPPGRKGWYYAYVKDGDAIIWRGESVQEVEGDYELSERLLRRAMAWADEHYPDWRDPNAYWD